MTIMVSPPRHPLVDLIFKGESDCLMSRDQYNVFFILLTIFSTGSAVACLLTKGEFFKGNSHAFCIMTMCTYLSYPFGLVIAGGGRSPWSPCSQEGRYHSCAFVSVSSIVSYNIV